ncbi:hypothetical protein CYMTET_35612 [Cymbomonas tetramitiformis]|uniref:Uncharacterized protein n=1 Tax=Cymbomonas tetramitiformis TaxID=36881 RepID=A0AAE0KNY3_9CHLO|nr:hypothetical protein CYMTET_35612 [Cymbomonas tetramitiformis]
MKLECEMRCAMEAPITVYLRRREDSQGQTFVEVKGEDGRYFENSWPCTWRRDSLLKRWHIENTDNGAVLKSDSSTYVTKDEHLSQWKRVQTLKEVNVHLVDDFDEMDDFLEGRFDYAKKGISCELNYGEQGSETVFLLGRKDATGRPYFNIKNEFEKYLTFSRCHKSASWDDACFDAPGVPVPIVVGFAKRIVPTKAYFAQTAART